MGCLWAEDRGSKFHANHIKSLTLPFIPEQLGLTKSTIKDEGKTKSKEQFELVMIVSLLNTARKIIQLRLTIFPIPPDPTTNKGTMYNVIPADYWLAAIGLIRAYYRLRTKSTPPGDSLLVRRRAKAPLPIPIDFVSSARTPQTAVEDIANIDLNDDPGVGIFTPAIQDWREDGPFGHEYDTDPPIEALEKAFEKFDHFVGKCEPSIPLGSTRLPLGAETRKTVIDNISQGLKSLTANSKPVTSDPVAQKHLSLAEASATNIQIPRLENDLEPTFYEACKELVLNPDHLQVSISTVVRPGNPVTLHPWQVIGVAWLMSFLRAHRGGILADDCGVGKTIRTLTFLTLLAQQAQQEASRFAKVGV